MRKLVIAVFIVQIAIVATVGYVAFHFISKFW